jgi:hypothetical protein
MPQSVLNIRGSTLQGFAITAAERKPLGEYAMNRRAMPQRINAHQPVERIQKEGCQ